MSKEMMYSAKFVCNCNCPSEPEYGLMAPLTKLIERDDACHHGGYTTFMVPTISRPGADIQLLQGDFYVTGPVSQC